MKKSFILSICIISVLCGLSGVAYAGQGSNIHFQNGLTWDDYNAKSALQDLCRYTDELEERIENLEHKVEELERKVK